MAKLNILIIFTKEKCACIGETQFPPHIAGTFEVLKNSASVKYLANPREFDKFPVGYFVEILGYRQIITYNLIISYTAFALKELYNAVSIQLL